MKTKLLAFTLLASTVAALAQGKINMVNDANYLLTFDTAGSLEPADAALAGQSLTLAATPSGATFLVDLYGGANAGSMTLKTTVAINGSIPGGFGPFNFISTLPGGAASTFQVQVRQTGFGTAALAQYGGAYYGFSPIFTMISSSTIAYNSIVNAGGTALSTWAAGNIIVYGFIPEPSSFSFAVLGIGALLVSRRRL